MSGGYARLPDDPVELLIERMRNAEARLSELERPSGMQMLDTYTTGDTTPVSSASTGTTSMSKTVKIDLTLTREMRLFVIGRATLIGSTGITSAVGGQIAGSVTILTDGGSLGDDFGRADLSFSPLGGSSLSTTMSVWQVLGLSFARTLPAGAHTFQAAASVTRQGTSGSVQLDELSFTVFVLGSAR